MKIPFSNYSLQLPAVTEARREARTQRRADNLRFNNVETVDLFIFLKKKTRLQHQIAADWEASRSGMQPAVPGAGQSPAGAMTHASGSVDGAHEQPQDTLAGQAAADGGLADSAPITEAQLVAENWRARTKGDGAVPAQTQSTVLPPVGVAETQVSEKPPSMHSVMSPDDALYWVPESFSEVKNAWQTWLSKNYGEETQAGKKAEQFPDYDELMRIGFELTRYLNSEVQEPAEDIQSFLEDLPQPVKDAVVKLRGFCSVARTRQALDWTDNELPGDQTDNEKLSAAWQRWVGQAVEHCVAGVTSAEQVQAIASELNRYLRGEADASVEVMSPFLTSLNRVQLNMIDYISENQRAQQGTSAGATPVLPASSSIDPRRAPTEKQLDIGENKPLPIQLGLWAISAPAGEDREAALASIREWSKFHQERKTSLSDGKVLNLSGLGLTSVPPVSGIKKINMNNNGITALPELNELPATLEQLWLQGNLVTHIPDSYFKLGDRSAALIIILDDTVDSSIQERSKTSTSEKVFFSFVEPRPPSPVS